VKDSTDRDESARVIRRIFRREDGQGRCITLEPVQRGKSVPKISPDNIAPKLFAGNPSDDFDILA
jgi:hypothetical protein